MASADMDLYADFTDETAAPQWGGGNNPFNVPATGASAATGRPPSNSAGNPLMNRPPSKWGGGPPASQWGGVPPSQGGALRNADARPMTSVRGSGFNASGGANGGGSSVFDPTGQGRTMGGPAPPLQRRGENSPEEQCMEMERQVSALIEESAMLAMQGNHGGALEKAKEAGKKDRSLQKQREQLNLADSNNIDLSFAVLFNLAVQFHRHQLYTDALNTYSLLIRNPGYPQAARLRVNMGNIYAEQKKYLLAVKMYRMTLQDIPTAGKEIRMKITRNIGNAFIRMGQYRDAMQSYEVVMDGSPDIITGFNLLLCYYALGDVEKLKSTFGRLLMIRGVGGDDDDDDDDKGKSNVLIEDGLRLEMKARRRQHLKFVTTGARLIAPILDRDWRVGFDWVIEVLRQHELHNSSANLAAELEMCKALNYLKFKKYKEAIDGLKAFEKKDKHLRARAATNLAYLYFLEEDYDSGEKYSEMSIQHDRYNAKALVNKGNFLYQKEDYDAARQCYNEALAVEVDNVEAIYNLGLTTKALGLYAEALRLFTRLQSMVESVEVLYQIADINVITGDPSAIDWYGRLISRVPTDPGALATLGKLYARQRDQSQAYVNFVESYRYFQANMDVLSWLGAYFVQNEIYDKALEFFEAASQIEPHDKKWQLMTASCYRRRGEYAQAKRLYEAIHRKHPDDLESLTFLVAICKDAGLMEESNAWLRLAKRLEDKLEERKKASPELLLGADDGGDEDGFAREDEVLRKRGGGAGAGLSGGSPSGGAAEKPKKAKKVESDDDDDMALPGL